MEGACLLQADLRMAHMEAANLKSANLNLANLKYAVPTGACLIDANLRWAVLDNANLARANLFGTDLEGARLRGANLEDASLFAANLRDADFTGANLRGADLRRACILGANFDKANLHEARRDGPFMVVREFGKLPTLVDEAKAWAALDEDLREIVELERLDKEYGFDDVWPEMERIVTHGDYGCPDDGEIEIQDDANQEGDLSVVDCAMEVSPSHLDEPSGWWEADLESELHAWLLNEGGNLSEWYGVGGCNPAWDMRECHDMGEDWILDDVPDENDR